MNVAKDFRGSKAQTFFDCLDRVKVNYLCRHALLGTDDSGRQILSKSLFDREHDQRCFKASFEDLQDSQHRTLLVCIPTGTRTRGEGPLRWWVSDRAFKVPPTHFTTVSMSGDRRLETLVPFNYLASVWGLCACGSAMLQYSLRVDAQWGCDAVCNVKSNPIQSAYNW